MGARDAIAKKLMEGIRAFHSSPHDIDKFDLSKVGTGQGSQSYGHGLYFAENPAVSGQGGEYWKEFARHPSIGKTERDAADFLSLHNFDRQKAAAQTRSQLERNSEFAKTVRSPEELASLEKERAEFEKVVQLLESGKPVGPRTYETLIKAKPEEFLQWDKPLGEQPHILDALKDRGYKPAPWPYGERIMQEGPSGSILDMKDSGADVYRSLGRIQGPYGAKFDKPMASQALAESGVPGVRYADQHTRQLLSDLENAQKAHREMASGGRKDWGAWGEEIERLQQQPQTYNYVVNDPSKLEILKKYGIAGATAAPLGMGAFASQDRYEAQ